MNWTVTVDRKTVKTISKLPIKLQDILAVLIKEIETKGPVRGNWKNYGKLGDRHHHCHLKKGHPTYVAVWEERDNRIKLVEITYVGTHERAPY